MEAILVAIVQVVQHVHGTADEAKGEEAQQRYDHAVGVEKLFSEHQRRQHEQVLDPLVRAEQSHNRHLAPRLRFGEILGEMGQVDKATFPDVRDFAGRSRRIAHRERLIFRRDWGIIDRRRAF